ncbi:MAG TPA: patatin-like phospholipase family protein [Longimicrobiales bacterium]|nr:patatin-like phospholipase family protein [Longimicrobiales bacterium]
MDADHAASKAVEYHLGLVLTGGGARGAYQVGVLKWIARRYPEMHFPILTGVSAGAVNTAALAAAPGTFGQAVESLEQMWRGLSVSDIFRVDSLSLARSAMGWGARLLSGGNRGAPRVRGLLDTQPLRELLHEMLGPVNGEITGIDYNLAQDKLRAVAIITTSYTTGQTVVWLKGTGIRPWRRPQRRTEMAPITVETIMASAALPIFFPAVQIGSEWYGDGGIRLVAPLSPALHLGSDRILAISTRYDKSPPEAGAREISGYPPPAQVVGVLLNAVFLDLVDQDAIRLERLNELLDKLPAEERLGMRPVRLMTVRPSQDLARLAAEFEPQLPRSFRFMTRGLGTQEQRSPDVLSMLMFQPDYLSHLIDLGEADAERMAPELEAFFEARPGTGREEQPVRQWIVDEGAPAS